MAGITFGSSSSTLKGASGSAQVQLYDGSGNAIYVAQNAAFVSANQKAIPVASLNDASLVFNRCDRTGGQALAYGTPLLHEDVEGSTLNSQRWNTTNTTMAVGQSNANIIINNASITTANTNCTLLSLKQFFKTQRQIIHAKIRARANFIANSVIEFGFGTSTGASIHNNGAYWQFTSAGQCVPVLAYNGTEVTGTNIAGSLSASNYYVWDVWLDDDSATFTCQDSSTQAIISQQTLQLPLAQPRMFNVTHVPAMARVYIAGVSPASAPQLLIGEFYVESLDVNMVKLWPQTMAQNARSALFSPTAYSQLAQFANSAAPSSATLSNTAAGYTTLGGIYQFAAVAGAATDYNLFNYTVPSGYQLVVTGITIDCWNTGAAVATTPTLLVWGLGVQGTTANLSSGGYIRTGLGSQSLPVAAAIGANTTQIVRRFNTPIVCDGSRLLSVILRMPVGTATASQVVAGLVNIEGFFE